MAGQRGNHVFLSERHAAVVTNTNAAITELTKTINIDSWGRTAPFPYDTMRSAPDTSFDGHGNVGGKSSYQWYTTIEVACQDFRKTLVDWRRYNEELDWGFLNNLSEHDLPNQIAPLNCNERSQGWTTGYIRRWNRPNLHVLMPVDSGQDETSSTRCRFDPWSRSRPGEGLPDEQLAVRRSSLLLWPRTAAVQQRASRKSQSHRTSVCE